MKFVSTAIVLSLVSVSAFAQVKVKKAWDEAEEGVKTAKADFKEKCGTDVDVSFDKASFGSDLAQVNAATWAKDAISSVATVCSDKDYKAAIAKDVKKIVFKYDTTTKKDSPEYGNKFELKGGTLTHSYNKDAANLSSLPGEWVKEKL